MTTFVRRRRIIDRLQQQAEGEVTELARQLDASEGTLRNDLRGREESGQLVRVRGGSYGAMLDEKYPSKGRSPAFAARLNLNAAAKGRLARWACELVEDGDSIFGVNNHQVGHVAGRAPGQWILENWGGKFDPLIVVDHVDIDVHNIDQFCPE